MCTIFVHSCSNFASLCHKRIGFLFACIMFIHVRLYIFTCVPSGEKREPKTYQTLVALALNLVLGPWTRRNKKKPFQKRRRGLFSKLECVCRCDKVEANFVLARWDTKAKRLVSFGIEPVRVPVGFLQP